MKASLTNYRHATRKVRLVTDSVKGQRVDVALTTLSHAKKKGADQIKKLIQSAVANAKVQDTSLSEGGLFIKNITVDQGMVMRRFMPRARGRAAPVKRESSHVRVVLAKIASGKAETKEVAKTETKAVKGEGVEKKPRAKKTTTKVAK